MAGVLHAGENRIVVREHDSPWRHLGIEVLEAVERALVEIDVEVSEADPVLVKVGGGVGEVALVVVDVVEVLQEVLDRFERGGELFLAVDAPVFFVRFGSPSNVSNKCNGLSFFRSHNSRAETP